MLRATGARGGERIRGLRSRNWERGGHPFNRRFKLKLDNPESDGWFDVTKLAPVKK